MAISAEVDPSKPVELAVGSLLQKSDGLIVHVDGGMGDVLGGVVQVLLLDGKA